MQKRYTAKNPYNEFTVGEYYSEAEIDDIYDDISDTITQTDLDNAIADFVTEDNIHVRASAFTEDFQSESTIDSIVSDFAADWVEYTTINSKIESATREFLDQDELNEKMSNFLVNYVSNTNVSLLIDSAITYYQEEYWHPEPTYERYIDVYVPGSIGNEFRDYINFVVSSSTAWQITGFVPIWLSLEVLSGFGTTVIKAEAQSDNTGSPRSVTFDLEADDTYPSSIEFTITQAGSEEPPAG